MRGHHHDFKEASNIIMTSKYNEDFNKPHDPQALH